MSFEEKLEAMGIQVPEVAAPAAKYVPYKRTGNLIFTSGQLPTQNGKLMYEGQLGREFTVEDGQAAARICAINIIAAIKACMGDLNLVKSIVKLQIFVNSAEDFTKQHLVANGASELLGEVFGDAGLHARTAVGVNRLPMNAAVEVEAIIEVI